MRARSTGCGSRAGPLTSPTTREPCSRAGCARSGGGRPAAGRLAVAAVRGVWIGVRGGTGQPGRAGRTARDAVAVFPEALVERAWETLRAEWPAYDRELAGCVRRGDGWLFHELLNRVVRYPYISWFAAHAGTARTRSARPVGAAVRAGGGHRRVERAHLAGGCAGRPTCGPCGHGLGVGWVRVVRGSLDD